MVTVVVVMMVIVMVVHVHCFCIERDTVDSNRQIEQVRNVWKKQMEF